MTATASWKGSGAWDYRESDAAVHDHLQTTDLYDLQQHDGRLQRHDGRLQRAATPLVDASWPAVT